MSKIKTILNTFSYRLKNKKNNVRISLLAAIDDGCTLKENVKVDRFCILHKTFIDMYSYIGFNTHIKNCNIGKFCSISSDVKIGFANHPTHMPSSSPVFYSKDNPFGVNFSSDDNSFEEYDEVNIGNDVWIGTNVIILGGITVGNGAVIGAGSIVTKDVEPYTVVAGNPAKTIKKRFDDITIEKLLKLQWWDWDDDKLKNNSKLFTDVELLLKYQDNR